MNMKITDIIPMKDTLPIQEDLDQVIGMIKDHYQMQLGEFISELHMDDWGISVYSKMTFDPMWNHAAVFPGSETWLPSKLVDMETFALNHRRYSNVYIMAESPGAEKALAILSKANYEVMRVESWMVYRHIGSLPQVVAGSMEIKEVQTGAELNHFVDIFDDSFSTRHVYMGDALKSQFYAQAPGNVKHFIGYVRQVPVCIATLIIGAGGNACIYNVGTAGKERKKGYGASITAFLINESIKSGHRRLFLQVNHSSEAERLYSRLGFEELFHRIGLVLESGIPMHEAEPFWRSRLQNIDAPIILPLEKKAVMELKPGEVVHAAVYREIPAALQNAFEEFISLHRLTIDSLVIGAWSLLLNLYCNLDKVLFGVGFPGKEADEFLFPIPVQVDHRMLPVSWLQSVAKLENRIEQYGEIPLLDIQEWSHIPGKHRLFNILLEFVDNTGDRELSGKRIYPLVCRFIRQEKSFEISYMRSHFHEYSIGRMMERLLHLLGGILKYQTQPLSTLELVTEEEKRDILYRFNDTAAAYAGDKTIHWLFEDQVEKTPHCLALTAPRAGNRFTLTYRELNQRCNRLARLLRSGGVKPDTIVGIMVEPTLEMVIGILAVLKAGGSYLPIDPDQPEERIKYMLSDSGSGWLLTLGNLTLACHLNFTGVAINIDDNNIFKKYKYKGDRNLKHINKPVDAVYMIYTSGTSGKSKGVLLKHENLVNYVSWFSRATGLTGRDRTVLTSSFGFDLGYTSVYPSLLNGCELYIIPKDIYADAEQFINYISKNKISYIKLTPSLFAILAEGTYLAPWMFRTLRLVVLGGEEIRLRDVEKVHDMCPHIQFMNHYGPTEAAIGCIARFIDFEQFEDYVHCPTIGKPINNARIYIMDRNFNLLPPGIGGELYIAGACLARGYLNHPELSQKKFISITELQRGQLDVIPAVKDFNVPFGSGANILSFQNFIVPGAEGSGTRFYCTGDLARWTYEGNVEFLGRVDHQVKIRGYRIELGEIEVRLKSFDKIDDAAVIADKNETGEKYICAYIVAGQRDLSTEKRVYGARHELQIEGRETWLAGQVRVPTPRNLDFGEIRDYLAVVLPDYMIPSYFVALDKIPLTPNGKLDRKALPRPELEVAAAYAASRDVVEQRLVEIWSDILFGRGRETSHTYRSIGIDDNFFDLGGHSLKGTILVARIHKEFNVRLSLAEIFSMPVIRQLSEYIKYSTADKYLSIAPVEEKDYYILSPAQKRLYILDQMEVENTTYNMPSLFMLEEAPDRKRLEEAFRQLIVRHESFRTSFHLVNEEPLEVIHAPGEIEFAIENYNITETGEGKTENGERPVDDECRDLIYQIQSTSGPPSPGLKWTVSGEAEDRKESLVLTHTGEPSTCNLQSVASIIKRFVRPFDLSCAPLLRAALAGHVDGQYLLLLDIHHIISDGVSNKIFRKELIELYESKELTPLKIRYKDYAEWQGKESRKERIRNQEEYWLNEFAGEIPVLNLPLDYPRPPVQSFAGDTIAFDLSREELQALMNLSREEGTTLFMVLIAIFYILLVKLSGQEDIIIGTPTAGRGNPDLENIIGMFVNTLVLRSYPSAGKSFQEFLKEIKIKTLEAFENQDYPFEDLVELLNVDRDAGRNPLFDVMFVLQNIGVGEETNRNLKLKSYRYDQDTAKFDMTLIARETEEGLSFDLEYCTKLFKEETIERFINYFRKILSTIIENPGEKISAIEIISEDEKGKILFNFNDTYTRYPAGKLIHQLFEEQAGKTPEYTAIEWQSTGCSGGTPPCNGFARDAGHHVLTYRKLNDRANHLARRLIKLGARPDTLVGIMANPSPEMIVGIFAILKVGGAYLPIDPEYPGERKQYMLRDSGSKILSTTHSLFEEGEEFGNVEVETVYLDEPGIRHQASGIRLGVQNAVHPQDLHLLPAPATSMAYVIYTSGSTGKPKGVLVEHRAAVNILFSLNESYPIYPEDRYLLKTSFIFDVSVAELFGWFFGGRRLVILGEDERREPQKIIDTIELSKITHINFVPSLFNVFLELLDYRNIHKLETLRYIFLAGEALSPQLVKKFRSLGSKVVLENLYGPTEGTVYSSRYPLWHWEGTGNIPIGKPLHNIKLYILDKGGHLQPIGIPGELIISGTGLARGYLNNPELTPERFMKDPFPGGDRLYRTGDLTQWLSDGNISFLGRLDHQVKIRGFRVELGEIEHRLLECDEIKEAVVTLRGDKKGDKYLCAYIVTKVPGYRDTEVKRYLSRTLPDFMIPSFFVLLDKLPLTASGKVDRKSLPELQKGAGVKYKAPRDKIEDKLVEIWSKFLELDKSIIGIDDNFFALGGHSLKGTLVISAIHKEFNVRMTLSEIFKMPMISRLSDHIREAAEDKYISIETAEKKDYYVLSSAQKRLYILDQIEFENKSYNMPMVFELEEEPDIRRLEDVFRKLIARHESFRTSFHMIGEEPVQKIHSSGEIDFKIQYYDLVEAGNQRLETRHTGVGVTPSLNSDSSDDRVPSEVAALNPPHEVGFVRPFNLSQAPLLRAGLVKSGSGGNLLMVDMHHIISDGISLEIFKRELVDFYELKELSALRNQYKDYSEWQNRESRKKKIAEKKDYWISQFADEIPILNLLTDYNRPVVQSFEGNTIYFELDEEVTGALKELGKEDGTTLFMVLAALFSILLGKLSGQEDIVVGTPAAGRSHPDLENIIGMFVNTLALRNSHTGEKRFKEFLQEIKRIMLNAFENQEYQFEELVDQLEVNRDAGRNPIFDVMFILQDKLSHKEGSLKLKPYKYNGNTAKFDLTLVAEESEQKLSFSLIYSTKLFKKETVNWFIGCFRKVISCVLENPGKKILEIEIISKTEKSEILFNFNNTETEYPRNKTIHRLFAEQSEKSPDTLAVVGRVGVILGSYPVVSLSYRALNQKSDQLAGLLKGNGIETNTIVGIMMERSIEMVIGVLGILKAGGAYLPIGPGYPVERKQYMLRDSSTKLVLTTRDQGEEVQKFKSSEVETIFLEEVEALRSPEGEQPPVWAPFKAADLISPHAVWHHAPYAVLHAVSSEILAYIIYTSGSTGQPKGVMVDHRNVVRLVKNTNYVEFRLGDRILPTGALEFDASTFEIWGALLNGIELYLEKDDIILSPGKIKETIQRNQVSTMWLTAPLFNQLLQEDIEIFRGLRNLLVGGDVLSPSHINRLRAEFPELNIINGYGPTENTTFSTTYLIDKEYQKNIPIGNAIANSTAYIVDRFNNLLPIGVPGELIVGGDGVARGYMNNPELTAEKFISAPGWWRDHNLNSYSLEPSPGEGEQLVTRKFSVHYSVSLYKTGDLTRWLPNGNIEFLGRMDQQVKIRGYRIELGEIESRLLKRDDIKETVVISRSDENGDKYLCAYIVPKVPRYISTEAQGPERAAIYLAQDDISESRPGPGKAGDLRQYLSQELPDYMIPSYFVFLDNIPLTPNRKLNRKLLPKPEVVSAMEYIAPQDEIEKKLAVIWKKVLNVASDVGIDDNFFELGGHSLKGTVLTAKIHKEFNVRISLSEIFRFPTIKQLGKHIKEAAPEKYLPIESAKKKDYYELSSAQKRLYILDQMEFESTSYNIPSLFILEEEPDRDKLKGALRKLMVRHESFRTSFHMIEGEPVQTIHSPDDIEFEIEYHIGWSMEQGVRSKNRAVSSVPATPNLQPVTSIIERFIRPFNLSKAPLFRAGLINLDEGKYLFMVDMHHIIADGTSMEIFKKELADFYESKELPSLRIQYKDYAKWQNEETKREKIKAQEDYWLKQFPGEVPVLNLPLDYPRPAVQSFEGKILDFELGAREPGALRELAREENVTLFMVLTAISNILLAKLSGQEDIVIGTPAAGRSHPDLENIIGMFINTLALRTYPGGEKRFKEFLQEVKNVTLNAFENQFYQFEDLVDLLNVSRDASRNPLFDGMFALQNIEWEKRDRTLKLKPYRYDYNIAKFDLILIAKEGGEETLSFCFQYCTKLFKQETIERYISYFRNLVTTVLESPEEKLAELEIISDEEKREILEDFNNRETEYPRDKTIQQLFAEQVAKKPDRIAIAGLCIEAAGRRQAVSYRQLNEGARQLAEVLIEKGVRPDTPVAVIMDRSIEMIIGVLAILKAGGAYLPIEPECPSKRIEYMLNDTGSQLLLTQGKYINQAAGYGLKVFDIEDKKFNRNSAGNLKGNGGPGNLAYIIYTSGTTGRPKGTLTTHYNVIRVVKNTNYIDIEEYDRILQLSNYAFDGSVFDIYGALLNGAVLVMIEWENVLAVDRLSALIKREKVTVFFMTTALFNALVDIQIDCFKSVSRILFGGERVSVAHSKKAFTYLGKARLIHVYGPTETTVYATYYFIDRMDETMSTIPIGTPISNTIVYILDKGMKPVPQGVIGEIFIGGDGIARGYLNRPELTAERFLESPYPSPTAQRCSPTATHHSLPIIHLYRTGDLGVWLPDKNIEFIGRIDHQVKLRGFRVELGEIEDQLLKHKDIKEVVVTVGGNEVGDKYLCAYLVTKVQRYRGAEAKARGAQRVAASDIREYLSHTLPDYMIPTYFIFLDKIPLTPNGKVDRKLLPEPEVIRNKEYAAPRDGIEKRLAEIWQAVLNISSEVGIDDNFFELGGHSLKGTVLTAKIHKEFNARISLAEIFKFQTIRKLAQHMKEAAKDEYISIKPVEKKKHYSLSFNQKRLWFIHQREPRSPAFNMPAVIELRHHVDGGALKKALGELIQRHESLRTGFKTVSDEPVQFIVPEVDELPFREFDISHLNESERNREWEQVFKDESSRVFDLAQVPLFRSVLVKFAGKDSKLIFTMHHIISDGWSLELFRKELIYLYMSYRAGQPIKLEPLNLQYKDFAGWHSRQVTNSSISEGAYKFWKKKVEQGIPQLELPRSISGDSRNLRGAMYRFLIPGEMKDNLKKLGKTYNTTLFMIMFATYIIDLSRYSNQEDIVCSIISAGRVHESFFSIIGFFVNSILFKIQVNEEEGFDKFLHRIHTDAQEYFQHQSYPLEIIFEEMRMRYPDIPVAFNMVNMQGVAGAVDNCRGKNMILIDGSTGTGDMEPFEPYHTTDTHDVKFDLEPYVIEYKNGIDTQWVYKKSMFSATTIEYFVKDYIKLLEFFVNQPSKSYGDFKAAHRKEKEKFRFKIHP